MKFLYIVDADLRDCLVGKGYRLIQTTKFNNGAAWVFENKPDQPLCFDMKSDEYKTKCFTADSLRISL